MPELDERLLERRMTEIEQARAWSPRVVSRATPLFAASRAARASIGSCTETFSQKQK
jgi:hypothetical protein